VIANAQCNGLQRNGHDRNPTISANVVGVIVQARDKLYVYDLVAMGYTRGKSGKPHAPHNRRRIIVVVVPPIEELDLVGPLQVFSSVNRLAGDAVYSVEVVTNAKQLEVGGEGGLLKFLAQGYLKDVHGRFDSVLLVCGVGTRNANDPELLAWLKRAEIGVRRLGAVCIGAFLFAEAGLLKGRKATAHWKFGQELAKRFPSIKVESDRLWAKDGKIYTSAGISAGIDLALAWVEEDCGSALAHEAARELVLFLQRPGGQQQLSVSLASQSSEMKVLRELQVWIAENLNRRVAVKDLAERVAMSVRTFERLFTREIGRTPSQHVMLMRVEAARRQLERTDRGLKEIASSCGFGGVDVMNRAFVRLLGMTPSKYRKQIVPEKN
jgi:transcriptional regulator GlxA family with amidase domain